MAKKLTRPEREKARKRRSRVWVTELKTGKSSLNTLAASSFGKGKGEQSKKTQGKGKRL